MKFLFISIQFVLFILSIDNVFAQNLITDPILVHNEELHGDDISSLYVDELGGVFLTTSYDQTAKVWSINDCSYLKTFRIPILPAPYQIPISTGYISVKDNLVILSTSGDESGSNSSIFVFNFSSGILMKRIQLQPGLDLCKIIRRGDLIYVQNGSRKISIIDMKNWSILKTVGAGDEKFIDFVSYHDHFLILLKNKIYEVDDSLYLNKTIQIQDQSYNKIHVARDNNVILEIRKSNLLSVVNIITDKQSYYKVCENRYRGVAYDGNYIWVSEGSYFDDKTESSRDRYKKISVNDFSTVEEVSIKSQSFTSNFFLLKDGNIIFTGDYPPTIGITYNQGKSSIVKSGMQIELKIEEDKKLIFYDNKNVLSLHTIDSVISFDIDSRSFVKPVITSELLPDLISKDQIGKHEFHYGGVKIFNDEHLTVHTIDIDHNQNLILGTTTGMQLFNKYGKPISRFVELLDDALSVKFSEDSKYIIILFNSGNIQFYEVKSMKLFLSCQLFPKTNQWVVWTPSGYYDAAPNSEAFLGWHINQGPVREPLFYPASQFRHKYYRPEVINYILQTGNEEEALRLADQGKISGGRKSILQMLPPLLTITEPSSGTRVLSQNISIGYRISSPPDAPVLDVWAMVNGTRGLRPVTKYSSGEGTLEVNIPATNCTVSLYARNKNGISEAASINLIWAGSNQLPITKPNLYVLAIGVSEYLNSEYKLDYPHKDAIDVAAAFKSQEGKIFGSVHNRVLPNSQATTANIRKELSWLKKSTTQHDLAILFFAGHGMKDNTDDFYFFAHETDMEDLSATGLPQSIVLNEFEKIAGKAIIFMDACNSGALGKKTRSMNMDKVFNDFAQAEGKVTFCSSTGKQLSQEDPKWQNGAFTEALLAGLAGGADFDKNGIIYIKELDLFITNEVKRLTNGDQSPTTKIPADVPDFPVGMK